MNSNIKMYSLAEIKMEINGGGELAKSLRDEFKYIEAESDNKKIDFRINVIEDSKILNFEPLFYSLQGSIAFNRNNYLKKEREYTYIVKNLFNLSEVTELFIYYNKNENFIRSSKNTVKSVTGSRGKVTNISRIKDDIMSYNLFWYVFPMVLLKQNKAFIHSDNFEYKNEGYVFTGTSGCGKTSATFKVLESEEAKYLADDFGIIDDQGEMYYNPKKVGIYQSDVRYGQKHLVNYINNKMTRSDKLLWKISNSQKKNPMRKIASDELLEESISMQTAMSHVYFLSRYSKEGITVEDITTEALVQRISDASFRELKMLYEILMNIKSVGSDEVDFPTFTDIQERVNQIYLKAFKGVEKKIVYLPLKSSPEKLLKAIGLGE